MGEPAKPPWQTRSDGWQPWPGAIQILGADGYVVAYTATGGPEKENADLLVKAVNSLGPSLDALEDICRSRGLPPTADSLGLLIEEFVNSNGGAQK